MYLAAQHAQCSVCHLSTHFASILKTAGYGTTLVGKWHLGRLPNFGPLKSGYDRFYGFRGGSLDYYTHKFGPPNTDTDDLWDGDAKVHQVGYLTDLLGDRAINEVNTYARSGQPFLISLHFNAPHWPWEAPGDEAEAQRLTSLFHFDGGTQKTYARMVMQMDLQVGRVLQALEANNLAENTIVVFTSDNGGERFSDTWPFTGKKTELLEGGLRIPSIVRWPARIPPGHVSDQVMISHGLDADVAGGGRRRPRSSIYDGRHELDPGAYAQNSAGPAHPVLALQEQDSAGHARRRLEMAEDRRQHVSVRRRERSAGTCQRQEPAQGHIRADGNAIRSLGGDHVAGGSAVVFRWLHWLTACGSFRTTRGKPVATPKG